MLKHYAHELFSNGCLYFRLVLDFIFPTFLLLLETLLDINGKNNNCTGPCTHANYVLSHFNKLGMLLCNVNIAVSRLDHANLAFNNL